MRATTHIAGAACAYATTGLLSGLPLTPGATALAAGCGLLADVDTRASTVGRLSGPVSRFLERRFGHRTATHSYVGQAAFAACCLPLAVWGPTHAYVAAVVGYASHPLLDTLTVEGVRLFWPWSDARCVFPFYERRPQAYRIRTGSSGDRLFCGLFCTLFLAVALIQHAGYARLIRLAQADASSAVRDYLDMSRTHLVAVELEANDPGSGRVLAGTFEAVGSTDYNTLLVRDTAGTIFSVGRPYEANFRARRAVCRRGRPTRIESRTVRLTGRLLADLEAYVPTSTGGAPVRHFLTGTVRLSEPAEVTPDPTHFMPLRTGGPMLTLRYATLDDLRRAGLSSALVDEGAVTARLFLEPGRAETYRASTARHFERVAFRHERGRTPRLFIRRGATVAAGDTLAVLADEEVRLAQRRLANAEADLHTHAAAAPVPTTHRKAVAAAREQAQAARTHQDQTRDLLDRGFAAAAQLQTAEAAARTAADRLRLLQTETQSHRARHAQRARTLEAQAEAARLTLRRETARHVVLSPATGRIARIEHSPRPDGDVDVRLLLDVSDSTTTTTDPTPPMP